MRKSFGCGSVKGRDQGEAQGPDGVRAGLPVCWRFSQDQTRRSCRSWARPSDCTQQAGPVNVVEGVPKVRGQEAAVFVSRVEPQPTADGVDSGLAAIECPEYQLSGGAKSGCHIYGHCAQQGYRTGFDGLLSAWGDPGDDGPGTWCGGLARARPGGAAPCHVFLARGWVAFVHLLGHCRREGG